MTIKLKHLTLDNTCTYDLTASKRSDTKIIVVGTSVMFDMHINCGRKVQLRSFFLAFDRDNTTLLQYG